mmetsp:Transcript_2671/g.5832  ORF Transcript_2671/g.5832 Transcript_2671/m.5832 type:complete len:218 (+) Transcript_2671:84-737(+)
MRGPAAAGYLTAGSCGSCGSAVHQSCNAAASRRAPAIAAVLCTIILQSGRTSAMRTRGPAPSRPTQCSCCSPMATDTPIETIMPPTAAAARVSARGSPTSTPTAPTAAAREDIASERWCFALASRTCWRVRRATARVIRKRASLHAMATSATRSGGVPSTATGAERRQSDRPALHIMATPAVDSRPAMTRVAARSKLGGAWTASIVTASTSRSEPLW